MNIKIAAVGKQKYVFFSEAEREYLKRVKRFANTEIIRSKESTPSKEGEWFLRQAEKRVAILLDENGKKFDSLQFARFLQQQKKNQKDLVFLIGGHQGIPKNVASVATYQISLSPFTFTHLMVPTILLEQLYRAFTILEGHPYHRT